MSNRVLTKRQKLFVEEYLRTWKASEAARQAGYKHPDVIGARLMTHPLISALIEQRMDEISMQTDEVLTRLTQQARVNLGDFLIITDWYNPKLKRTEKRVSIDWDKVKSDGFLIKELNWSRGGNPVLKLHDAQSALTLIGKARRMFVEQVEETHHIDNANVNIYIPDNGRDPVVKPVESEADGSD